MNTSTVSLHGVFPPIPTPFDSQGEVALPALIENLERWNAYDLAGYVVLGSNGEAVYLTEREKLQVWETARQAIPPDKLMIAGTGCESTRQTVALTRQAAGAGADAALVVTPHYFDSKMTPGGLVRHYESVADASPIPVVLYNVPKFTHVDMDAGTIARAARHPNVIGIKDSGGNVAKLADVVRLTGPDFQVLAGAAGFFFAGLALGAVGGVLALANVAPQQAIDIQRLFEAGRWDEAAELQRRMIPVNAAITARFGIAGLKAALDILGYYGGPVRSPLEDITGDDRQVLRDVLAEGGLL
jgi:4-hydroxy-2-oxoglutarate aldolase